MTAPLNVIFVSIDSLNRHFLTSYGGGFAPLPGDTARLLPTPNFDRLAARCATFDTHYAGSLPCMPARREYFAGVQEFLWRAWGPIEPFDVPIARAARSQGVVCQLVTDHFHYFEHGSHGYHEDYHGVEWIRGNEFDRWKTSPRDPDPVLLKQIKSADPHATTFLERSAYARNVASFKSVDDFFAPKVFTAAADWLRDNATAHPNWFLAIDSFDVHEPFHCPEPYASMFTDEDLRDPSLLLWPWYGRIDIGGSRLTERQLKFVRAQYAGKLAMVDMSLGRLLDRMDQLDLWDNTLLIVTADHGHYFGEHGWMGKPDAPMFDVISRTPLFVWMPGSGLMGGRVNALTSAVDHYATIRDAMQIAEPAPAYTHSRSLMPLLKAGTTSHRDWALWGYWGSTVNISDGRYTYLHPCRDDIPAYNYSTMMTKPHNWFTPPHARGDAETGRFIVGVDAPVWRYPDKSYTRHAEPLLFDTVDDPGQTNNLAGVGNAHESRMREMLIQVLCDMRVPQEQFERLRLAEIRRVGTAHRFHV